MKYKNFEDYMQEMFMQEEPCLLDDDLPDAFDAWVCELDADSWLAYGDKYAAIVKGQDND